MLNTPKPLPKPQVNICAIKPLWIAQARVVLNITDIYNQAIARLAQAKQLGKHSAISYWIDEIAAITQEFIAESKVEKSLRQWLALHKENA